ncbi:hypothetical protein BSL82_10180 [Tardibacter chloracetimidivorans]|uniref:Uncharacterized protein n=1 Tax=Tardibacter chloracetimidivorans TaxID=1921510 RepID=A0A1L3ZVM3_9SPHN|nr:hypothetical protein [Tardibacter chloracetimidivorans]API59640.1 hypothetical protein BSL82_10180 [Tardibacter chloracetimidivorans]
MCNAGAASLVTQGAGAVSSAAGAIFGASSQRTALGLQARFADINAGMAMDDARAVLQRGEFEEQRSRLQTAQLKSSQRATMGANGVDMSEGSPLDRLVSTDYLGEVDANTIRQNAAREAAGYRSRASGYRSDAIMARGARSGISPFLSGATSLLGSAGKIGKEWYALDKEGAFDRKPGSKRLGYNFSGADDRVFG